MTSWEQRKMNQDTANWLILLAFGAMVFALVCIVAATSKIGAGSRAHYIMSPAWSFALAALGGVAALFNLAGAVKAARAAQH